jgi:hypothetical protein
VLCVTHLPQVAAKANQHYLVSPSAAGAAVHQPDRAARPRPRVEEIARMLGGMEITATTRRHARDCWGERSARRAATASGGAATPTRGTAAIVVGTSPRALD